MGRTQNTLPRFDSNLQKGGQVSASQWNALANLINGAKAFDGIWLKLGPNGLHIGGGGSGGGATFPWTKLAFGYALTKTPADGETPASTQCTVYPGSIRLHGGTTYDIAETEVTLAGNPEWIFVEYNRASGGATINHSATEPTSTSAVVRIPLYRFDLASGVYSLGRICNMGDVNFDLPLR